MLKKIVFSSAILVAFVSLISFKEFPGKNYTANANTINQNCLPTKSQTVIINHIWATRNLDVDTFKNGEKIPEMRTAAMWAKANTDKTPAWCYYMSNADSGKVYGKLYNFYAVTDPRGLAPAGWHVATDADYKILIEFLGGEKTAGVKLKNKCGWILNGNGTNSVGFSGLAGGSRACDGEFDYIGYYGIYWTSDLFGTNHGWYYTLSASQERIFKDSNLKGCGFSVRCIKD